MNKAETKSFIDKCRETQERNMKSLNERNIKVSCDSGQWTLVLKKGSRQ